jgi:hypothetical protein
METNAVSNGTITLLDLEGKEVKTTSIQSGNGIQQFTLDIASLSAGMYTVRIQTNEGISTRKFVKK